MVLSSSSCRECFTFIFVFVLAILGAFKWAVFWLGVFCVSSPGIISITSYGRHKTDYTGDYGNLDFGTAGWASDELLNKTMPWHKLLVPEPADEAPRTVAR